MENIYDWENDQIVIEPFEYGMERDRVFQFLQLPDPLFLKYLSTSPEVEGPTFVKDSKATLAFWFHNPDYKQYFKGKPRVYKWSDESNSWKPL